MRGKAPAKPENKIGNDLFLMRLILLPLSLRRPIHYPVLVELSLGILRRIDEFRQRHSIHVNNPRDRFRGRLRGPPGV